MENKNSVEMIPKAILRNFINVNRTKFERFDLLEGQYTYSYIYNGLRLNFYAHIKASETKLTIILPGAVNRAKTLYNFQRHSWSKDIEGSVISFLDPTVSNENNITIGWFQGNKNSYAIPILINFVRNILETNGINEEDLTLFGSSAGGFTCLKIADSFLKSRIIVMNPQTRVYKYYKKSYRELVEWVFPNVLFDEVEELYKDRLTVSLNINKRQGDVLYYQNSDDKHHMLEHFKPFKESYNPSDYETVYSINKGFDTDKKLKFIQYSDLDRGHQPLNKEDTLRVLNNK